MRKRFHRQVTPSDGVHRYNILNSDYMKDANEGRMSRSNLNPNDGLHRFSRWTNKVGTLEEILESSSNVVEGILQDAGVSPRPSESRMAAMRATKQRRQLLPPLQPPVQQQSFVNRNNNGNFSRQDYDMKEGIGENESDVDRYADTMYVDDYGDDKNGLYLRNYTEEDREEQEEEVLFSHDIKNAQLYVDVSKSMSQLQAQIHNFRMKYFELIESKAAERRLNVQNMTLQSDLEDLQQQIDVTLGIGKRQPSLGLNKNRVPGAKAHREMTGKNKDPMMNDAEDDDEPEVLHHVTRRQKKWYEWRWKPFQKAIRRIEAKFGSSTCSYFTFSRWIFLEFFYILPLIIGFTALHIYKMIALYGYNFDVFTGGPSFLPRYMNFSSYHPGEAADYTACVLMGFLLMLINGVFKMVKDDKRYKEITAMEGENFYDSYAKDVLVAWDNSLLSQQECEDYAGALGQTLQQKLIDSRYAGQQKEMTTLDYILLYLRRVIGTIGFLVAQFVSFALIVYLTVYGDDVKMQIQATPLSPLSGFLINIALAVISGVTPEIMNLITDFEQWNSEMALRMILFRVYISNTLNILLIAISYILLADPTFLYDFPVLSRTLYVPISEKYKCRLDQVSDELFFLYFNDRLVNGAIVWATGLIPYISSRITGKPWIKVEIDVQQSILTNISSAGVAMIVFVFSPLSMLLLPLLKAINIYYEKIVMIKYYQKPKRNWNAEKAELTFTRFYVFSILLLGIPVLLFFVTSRSMSKDCGIQDSSIGACRADIINNVCEIDSTSRFYESVTTNGTGSNTGLCFNTFDTHYPRCLCAGELSCGPFVRDADALRSFKAFVTQNYYVGQIWKYTLSESYCGWTITFILLCVVLLKSNTIQTDKVSNEIKLTKLLNKCDYLEWANHHQDQIINKLKGGEK